MRFLGSSFVCALAEEGVRPRNASVTSSVRLRRTRLAMTAGAGLRPLAAVQLGTRITPRAAVGGVAVGMAMGWNIAALGAIATRLSHAYGVGLATIGLFTTV